MNKPVADILIFVEDPGAANFVMNLPDTLMGRGYSVVLFACGLAKGFLEKGNTEFIPIDNKQSVGSLVTSVNPKLILVGTASNKNSLSFLLIEEAHKKNIDSIGLIDAAMNAGKRFSGTSRNPLKYAPNWLMVPTESIKNSYIELGFGKDKVLVTGNPQYDFVKSYGEKIKNKKKKIRSKLFPNVPLNKKIVIFVTEGSARLKRYSKEQIAAFSLKGWGKGSSRTEVVIEELLEALNFYELNPYLVLRVHPKDKKDDYLAYLQDFNQVSDNGDYLELLAASDLVVGMTSMMMLEAALIGRETLSILPVETQKSWLPTIENGITHVATTKEEVKNAVNTMLGGISNKSTGLKKMPHIQVEGAVKRMVDIISEMLSKSLKCNE